MLIDVGIFEILKWIIILAFTIVCVKLIIDGIFYNRFVKLMSEADPNYQDIEEDEL